MLIQSFKLLIKLNRWNWNVFIKKILLKVRLFTVKYISVLKKPSLITPTLKLHPGLLII